MDFTRSSVLTPEVSLSLIHIFKYLVLQYMDTSQLIPFITESGAAHVFDYNPSELTPSHLPGELTTDANGQPVGSPTTRINRARWFARNLPFVCTPHSIHEIHQIQHILMKMQMKQRGAPIPWADIMEAASFEDVKRPTGSTIQERFFSDCLLYTSQDFLRRLRLGGPVYRGTPRAG